MAANSYTRLLRLVSRDYRPHAWRREEGVEELLSQFHDECSQLSEQYGRWIPYTMPAVAAVREALQDGTIQPAVVSQVIRDGYIHAFERNRPRMTRGIIRLAINRAA